MRRRIVPALGCLVLLAPMVACGKSESPPSSPTPAARSASASTGLATASPTASPFRPSPASVAWIPLPDANPWQLGAEDHALIVLSRDYPDGDGGSVTRVTIVDSPRAAFVRLPWDPWDMAVGAGAIWVTPNGLDANVLRLDSVSLRRVASIPGMPRNPMGPYLTASAGNVWVANSDERSKNGGRTVVEIDPATNKVVAELEVGPSPQSIVAGFGAVWTGDHDAPSLSRLDPMTGRRVTIRLTTEQIPHSLAVGAGFVWIGAPHSRVLVRVDPATNRVTGSFTYDVHPGSMAVDSHGWLWIAPSPHVDDVNNSLLVVDPASGGIMRAIDTGARPMALVAHDDEIWVATRSPSGLMAFYAFPGAPPTGSR